MRTTGIVDLGSNTARLVVYAFEPGKWFRLIDQIREPIRLGSGSSVDDRLSGSALERALEALRLYADYAGATNLDSLTVIATSAVRDAANRQVLIDRAEELGIRVEVLSGEEEARLGVTAVANGFAFDDAWVVDLGGGSAQLSCMRSRAAVSSHSVPFGAVRLTEAFLASDPPRADDVRALESGIADRLEGIAAQMKRDRLPLVAMGGSARNLARATQSGSYPLEPLHGYFVSRRDLETVTARLLCLRRRKRKQVAGIHPDRADVILAAALVYRWILRRVGAKGLHISGQGIREGAFYRQFLPAPHLLPDVRRFSVENLFQRHPQPRLHVRRVMKLSLRLFDGVAARLGADAADRDLLEAAVTLHDMGKTVNHYAHDLHGAYLVASSPLPGFSHAEQALVSLLVRYHRKGTPRLGRFKPLLGRGGKQRLLRLTACLRLAEKLERSRAGRVRDLEIELGRKALEVRLLSRESPFVELWEAGKQVRLFRQAFGRTLSLEAVTPAASRGAAHAR